MKNWKMLSLVICLSLSSCFTTRELALKDFSTEIIELPLKVDSIKIVDERENLLPMGWDVPLIGVKKREWKGNPKISELNKSDIESIIKKSEDTDGIPANFEFRVNEGLCQLNLDWKSVTEYAEFGGELIVSIPSRNLTYSTYSKMYYENPTLNGTEKGTMKLYNQAVKNVTHLLLKQVESEINKIENKNNDTK